MSEEEKKAIKALKIFNKIVEMVKFNYMGLDEEEKEFVNNNDYVYNTKKSIITVLNLIEKQQKELNNLKEIEKSHKEENGKLRVELEQEQEKNMQLNEKNIMYKSSIPNQSNFYDFSNYISKDKIKEKIEETNNEKLNYSENEYYLENEIKGYAIDKLKELLEEK